ARRIAWGRQRSLSPAPAPGRPRRKRRVPRRARDPLQRRRPSPNGPRGREAGDRNGRAVRRGRPVRRGAELRELVGRTRGRSVRRRAGTRGARGVRRATRTRAAAPVIDAFVLGRVGIDLYPNQLKTPLREVRTYTRFVGGFAGNVATGLARLGLTPAIVSRVGSDPHGDFVREFLSGEGVDVRFLAVDERLRTPPTFCEVWPPDRFPLTFYRYPTAPDWQLAPGDFDLDEVAAAPFLLATGTGLAQSPSRETTLGALEAHEHTTIFDLDWRPTLWEQPDEYSELAQAAVRHAGVVI